MEIPWVSGAKQTDPFTQFYQFLAALDRIPSKPNLVPNIIIHDVPQNAHSD